MASREKKLSTSRKPASASPVPPKEGVAATEAATKLGTAKTDVLQIDDTAPKLTAIKPATPKANAKSRSTVLAKKITKNVARKAISKTLTMSLKAKDKKPAKIKQQIAKALLNSAKSNLEGKKSVLLKNGVKKRIRKSKAQIQAEKLAKDDSPPVLEPILPLEQIVAKKPVKKRVKKVLAADDSKKVKVENSSTLSSIDETINSILSQIMAEDEQKVTPKKPRVRKPKVEATSDSISETIEDVMNDLSYLIKNEEVKHEGDTVSESSKTEVVKPKKPRKPRIDLLKKKIVKKENNLEKNITMDASAKHLIDMLDLSVHKSNQLSTPICNRRHSIEKFPIDALENSDNLAASVFSNLPRTVTPKSKRVSKVRQSVDAMLRVKRYSPYSTRSDSPAQILRNGKHRKVKETLFEGIDNEYKRRKRLCSDFSGSEKSVSKFSGYESDSSFSDLASLHGTDNLDQKEVKPEVLKKDVSEPLQNQINTQDNVNIKSISNKIANILKRTLSTETSPNGIAEDGMRSDNFMDSNSNLCNEIKAEVPVSSSENCKTLNELPENIGGNPSSKVPEKSIILDIMKQAFNDINTEDQERRTTRSSSKKSKPDEDKPPVSTNKFYGITSAPDIEPIEPIEPIEQSIVPEPTTDSQDVQEEKCPVVKEEEPPKLEQMEEPPKLEQMEVQFESNGADPDLTQPKDKSGPTSPELTDGDTNISDQKAEGKEEIEETPEDLAVKENILQALGLQSLKAAEEAKMKGKAVKNYYTGTLKTVIKLNRCDKKKGRNSLKMTLHKHKTKVMKDSELELVGMEEEQGQKNSKEATTTTWRSQAAQSSDTAGALRKSHYSNRSNNMDGSSEHTSDGDTATAEGEDSGKILVIPEKASSFSIHPGRLCKDECSYCFGKFGLFDTPCHIAQMKSVERQDKILETEKHLTRDSCLCDACYRHVDRKSNTPSYLNKGSKRSGIVAPGPRQNHCHVLSCSNIATNILRRKWLIKMRKSVCQVINIDLDNPGLHSIPICSGHYSALEHLMVCAMCKRRLARNHIHYLGPEISDLNMALNAEGIPAKLMDKPVVCKLCRYFASLVLKPVEERPENTNDFFKAYKRRLLHFHDIEIMDEATAEEPIPVPTKDKIEKESIKRKKKLHRSMANIGPPVLEPQVDLEKHDQSRLPSDSNSTSKSRSESPSDYMVDYNTLIPNIALECGSDAETSKRGETSLIPSSLKKSARPDSIIKEAVEISKTMKLKSDDKNSASAVQRLGSNPCISVRQLFPGEEELGLQGSIEFGTVKEKTPEGWEKCLTTIQYDGDTKLLWQELQKPYGNQSSFLRHLILLEKYFRNGDLILSANASHHSINYSESVQNRLRAYDNIPMNSYNLHGPLSVKKSSSGIITTKDSGTSVSIINAANIPKNTPITFSQINNLAPNVVNKARNPGVPPGLISLHTGTHRPAAPPLIKVPQPQKIKIPLTKNWRPNLIPIDPSKKSDKKPGYVKVISGGKPYHITVDDYNRMCAIKKSYDLKQKRMLEAQAMNTSTSSTQPSVSQTNSILKSIMPRKGLIISKTATITSPKSDHSLSDGIETENSLEKLDRTVENIESKFAESTSMMLLPKIPKSLTVIPQTVTHKPSRPSSPALMITAKPKPSTSKS